MECELLRSPMISYRSLLYNTTVLYDICDYAHAYKTHDSESRGQEEPATTE